jgi:diguanylate cyclase (GGDEF)-like protein
MTIRHLLWQIDSDPRGRTASAIIVPAADVSDHLQLAIRLHHSLDPQAVLGAFFDELQPRLKLHGISCRFDVDAGAIELGQASDCLVVYSLSSETELAGEVTISRAAVFDATEIAYLEAAVALLRPALRNALRYRAAVAASRLDPITGLGNRAALEESLGKQLHALQRHEQPLALALLEFGELAAIGESAGVRVGEQTVTAVAEVLSRYTRRSDSAFRYAGDRFALVMPRTGPTGAAKALERLTQARLPAGLPLPVTACTSAAAGDTPQSLLARTERIMGDVRRTTTLAA